MGNIFASMATPDDTVGEEIGHTTAFVPGVAGPDMELRRRAVEGQDPPRDPENIQNPPEPPEDEASRIQLAKCCMRVDMMICHTISQHLAKEERLENIEHHLFSVWGIRAPIHLLIQWIDHGDLYSNPAIAHLPGFDDFVAALSLEQVDNLIERSEAGLFCERGVKGRIRKFDDKNKLISSADRDLRHAFEVNLGVLIEERPRSVGDYVLLLRRKRELEWDRLDGVLKEARRLRDLATAAFRQGYLEQRLLPGLRARISSLNEYYDQARELLGGRNHGPLVGREYEDWLAPDRGLVARRRHQLTPTTLASLTVATLVFSMIAGYPALRGLLQLSNGPGSWTDAGFSSLLSSVILQVLNLATQLVAPRIWRLFFQRPRQGDAENGDEGTVALIWAVAFLALSFTLGSLVTYVYLSIQFSMWMAFAAQVFMGMVQLMLVYRD